MKGFLAVVGVLVAVFALMWAVEGNDFFMYKYFAPRQEQVRREVFENTKAYNQGMAQEVQDFHFQYIKAKPSERAALASVILEKTADYDINKLPPDSRQFIENLRTERGTGVK